MLIYETDHQQGMVMSGLFSYIFVDVSSRCICVNALVFLLTLTARGSTLAFTI